MKRYGTFALFYRPLRSKRRAQFGASALLDPTWDIDNLRRCSKPFRAVFKLLCAPELSIVPARRVANHSVFLTVVNTLTREDLTEHVNHMLSPISVTYTAHKTSGLTLHLSAYDLVPKITHAANEEPLIETIGDVPVLYATTEKQSRGLLHQHNFPTVDNQ
jgi:hypothetical protein